MECKKCNQCKKIKYDIDFIYENKTYSCCNSCRITIAERRGKNICEVCGIRARYNYKDIKHGSFCKDHKKAGMVDVSNKRCIEENCSKTPVYNFKGEKTRLYCKDHKKEGMLNIKDALCLLCEKQASYNYENETKASYCKEHSSSDMILIKGQTCKEKDCKNRPTHNYKNKPANYCKEHSKDEMVLIKKNKVCLQNGCDKHPSYNYKGLSKLYCKEHKLKNMIMVNAKKCLLCDKQASYNYKGETTKLYCKEHSKDGMMNITKKRKCLSCDKSPCYNYSEESVPIYCKEHKLINMVDIVHNVCYKEECLTKATYGYCSKQVSSCFKHKDDKMFKKPRRFCVEENCKEIATYGIKEPTHCEDHSMKDEFCLIVSTCTKCERKDEILDLEGLCLNFCSLIKLDDNHKKRQKQKENIMINYLDEYVKLPNNIIRIQDDKTIETFCNSYRPDRLYDCGTHAVIVECDEFQHKYKNICSKYRDIEHAELSRMHEVYNSIGLPCIFLRWNPDNFTVNGVINKKYNNRERLKLLVKWIEHCFTMVPDKYLSPVKYKYLFYDNFNEADISFLEIDDTKLI
jgi:hypothetical protein